MEDQYFDAKYVAAEVNYVYFYGTGTLNAVPASANKNSYNHYILFGMITGYVNILEAAARPGVSLTNSAKEGARAWLMRSDVGELENPVLIMHEDLATQLNDKNNTLEFKYTYTFVNTGIIDALFKCPSRAYFEASIHPTRKYKDAMRAWRPLDTVPAPV